MAFQLQKQQIYLIIGVVMALMALVMINVYLRQREREQQELARRKYEELMANQVPVLIAKDNIPRGTVIEPGMIEPKNFPSQYVQPGAATTVDRVAGMVTIVPIAKDDQITINKVAYLNKVEGLAELTPPGKRAITVSVDNIASLSGMLKPGDNVDVIAMVPIPVQTSEGKTATQVSVVPVFQNILVLAVGGETAGARAQQETLRYAKETKKEASPLITLALTPQEANLIAFIQEQGKIRLSLRAPTDTKVEPLQSANWDTLLDYLYPQRSAPKKEYNPSDYVEIYRGMNKEKILLSE